MAYLEFELYSRRFGKGFLGLFYRNIYKESFKNVMFKQFKLNNRAKKAFSFAILNKITVSKLV